MDKVKRIAKGYLIAVLLFMVLSFLGALLLKFTPFPDTWSFFYLLFSIGVACMFLGIYMGAFFGKAGLLCGLGFSIVLVLLIVLLVSLSFSSFISLSMLTPMYLIPIGLGGIGGVIGTNIS